MWIFYFQDFIQDFSREAIDLKIKIATVLSSISIQFELTLTHTPNVNTLMKWNDV